MSKPLAASLALTTAGAGLLAAVAEVCSVETLEGAALKKAVKPPPQYVSASEAASEAASGPHTSLQGTDALTSLPGSSYQATHAPDPHPRGGFLGREPPP